ncbi:MAG TPA: hypothetical protein VF108_05770 [Actinomycetota bacterium]
MEQAFWGGVTLVLLAVLLGLLTMMVTEDLRSAIERRRSEMFPAR